MQKGSLGSWHERQTFSTPCCNRMCMNHDGQMILLTGPHEIQALKLTKPKSPLVFTQHRMIMDYYKADFIFHPGGLNDLYLVSSNPYFRQTDGLVAIYRVQPNELQHVSKLLPPVRAGFFGCHVILKADWLFVSAPMANKGVGCIYVYRIPESQMIHTITPTKSHVTEFGKLFRVSDDGQHVAVVSEPQSLSVYRYETTQFVHKQHIQFPYGTKNLSVDIDNSGTVMVSDKHSVYHIIDQKGFDFVVGPQHSKVGKLSDVSPNRLRIRRGLQLHHKISGKPLKLFSIPE